MSGKRSGQGNNQAGGGSTDHNHKGGEGRNVDEHLMDHDKQELTSSNPHDQPMIPMSATNPAVRELRDRKKGEQAEREVGLSAATRADEKSEAKLDEALDESFPASDPPAMP